MCINGKELWSERLVLPSGLRAQSEGSKLKATYMYDGAGPGSLSEIDYVLMSQKDSELNKHSTSHEALEPNWHRLVMYVFTLSVCVHLECLRSSVLWQCTRLLYVSEYVFRTL